MEPIEAAFLHGEYDHDIGQPKWWGRITWKCPVCGRRNQQFLKGTGAMPVPLKVLCKHGHETLVKPYRS
jgi:hypothetical protein